MIINFVSIPIYANINDKKNQFQGHDTVECDYWNYALKEKLVVVLKTFSIVRTTYNHLPN